MSSILVLETYSCTEHILLSKSMLPPPFYTCPQLVTFGASGKKTKVDPATLMSDHSCLILSKMYKIIVWLVVGNVAGLENTFWSVRLHGYLARK